jgi:nickel superoxide dismutase
MMKLFLSLITVFVLLTATAGAHCQIPCGIYDDTVRITLIKEHVTTIEKSIAEISKLTCDSPQNNNQMTRWVINKEEHADQLSQIVTYYFMAQRIKPEMDGYTEKLKTLHAILRASMKAKQSADLADVDALRELIHQFEHLYLGEKHVH